jgi:hypothetical protein
MRTPHSKSKRALHMRDAGLRKISVTTRVLVVGSVAAAGAFASMAAWAQPGRSKVIRTAAPTGRQLVGTGAASATVPATVPATAPATLPQSGSYGDDGGYSLAPPATTPATAPATVPNPGYQYVAPSYQAPQPVVVSGAS